MSAIRMTGVDIAQNELGLTGRGLSVAVIDTGLDYDHPDLGGGFGPG
jgi:minor extracellular serine protease Vpr